LFKLVNQEPIVMYSEVIEILCFLSIRDAANSGARVNTPASTTAVAASVPLGYTMEEEASAGAVASTGSTTGE